MYIFSVRCQLDMLVLEVHGQLMRIRFVYLE
jgi:hypothetical protein